MNATNEKKTSTLIIPKLNGILEVVCGFTRFEAREENTYFIMKYSVKQLEITGKIYLFYS